MTNLIRSSLDIGYRHIDTAIAYGNESMIGEALATIFAEGKYKREDLFIVSKIFPWTSMNPLESVTKTLTDLKINKLDLLYLHWSFAPNKDGKPLEIVHRPVHV
jgi:diketogulonate reductase-like aldo/keto reductase